MSPTRIPVLSLVLVLSLALGGLASAATPRTEQQTYVAAEGSAVCTGIGIGDTDGNVGGGCFALDGTESTAEIFVADVSGDTVGWSYVFTDASGRKLAVDIYCGPGLVAVPAGASRLFVNPNVFTSIVGPATLSVIETGDELEQEFGRDSFHPSQAEHQCREVHTPTAGTITVTFA